MDLSVLVIFMVADTFMHIVMQLMSPLIFRVALFANCLVASLYLYWAVLAPLVVM